MNPTLVAFAVTIALAAALPQDRPTLAQRFPVPDGYALVDDDSETGTLDVFLARGRRGTILRRTLEAKPGATVSVAGVARVFGDRVRGAGGTIHGDRMTNAGGLLDGRIPGERPVWLHLDISDTGRSVAMVALDEAPGQPAVAVPVEEIRIPGAWRKPSRAPSRV
jgi:hypothetical protein